MEVEKVIAFFEDMKECTYGNLEEVEIAIKALENQKSIIEELEKIKTEFEELAYLFDDLSPDKTLVVDLDNIEEVIDKYISELKGENK